MLLVKHFYQTSELSNKSGESYLHGIRKSGGLSKYILHHNLEYVSICRSKLITYVLSLYFSIMMNWCYLGGGPALAFQTAVNTYYRHVWIMYLHYGCIIKLASFAFGIWPDFRSDLHFQIYHHVKNYWRFVPFSFIYLKLLSENTQQTLSLVLSVNEDS